MQSWNLIPRCFSRGPLRRLIRFTALSIAKRNPIAGLVLVTTSVRKQKPRRDNTRGFCYL